MKAATGELNLTVITVITIGAIPALFYTVLRPTIKENITNNSEGIFNPDESGNNPLSYVEHAEVEWC